MACKSRISVDQRMVWDAICRSIGSLEECKALELREGLKTRAFLFSFFVSWLKAVCVRNSVAMEVEGDEEYSRTLEEDLGGLKVERDAAVQGVVIDFLRLIFKTLRVFLEMEKEGLARMVRPRDCTEGTARALCASCRELFAEHRIPLKLENDECLDVLYRREVSKLGMALMLGGSGSRCN